MQDRRGCVVQHMRVCVVRGMKGCVMQDMRGCVMKGRGTCSAHGLAPCDLCRGGGAFQILHGWIPHPPQLHPQRHVVGRLGQTAAS